MKDKNEICEYDINHILGVNKIPIILQYNDS